MHNAFQIYNLLDKMLDKMGNVSNFGSKTVRDSTRVVSSCKNSLRRLIPGKHDDSTKPEVQESEKTLASTAPRMREILSSLTDQWPELLKAVDELKPHLDVISEKVDGALQIK